MNKPKDQDNDQDRPEKTPADDRADSVPAQWPGEKTLKPGKTDTTIIPLVR